MDFNEYILREQYKKVHGLGDRLALMKEQIDWAPFAPLVKSVFNNNAGVGVMAGAWNRRRRNDPGTAGEHERGGAGNSRL